MDLLFQGLVSILTPACLSLMVAGTIIGIIFGAIPGLSSVMAITLFLPVTYVMTPNMGLAILISLYIGSVSGGLISAILLKIPGTPNSVATCFDGHPLMEKGQGAKAVGVGIVFSFLGTLFSTFALIFIAPPLAKVALQFGPHEYFALALFSLMLIATLSSGSMIKGIFSGVLGIAFCTVGISPVDALKRYTFGFVELSNGFNMLTVLIGLFAIAEVIKVAETCRTEGKTDVGKIDMKFKGFGFSIKEFKEQLGNGLLAALVGLGIGIMPGIGGATSNLVAYTVVKNRSKYPEKFGTGIIDGIVASETANNAGIGGAMIPLMTLGIPGDGVTAILLGAFMVHGITPGPLLFIKQAPLVYSIFAALFIATFMMFFIEFYGLRVFVWLLRISKHILLPIIFVLCVIGAFGLSSRLFDVWSVILFGLVGYMFTKFKVPQGPFVIGFILGTMCETNFRRGLMLSDNNFFDFFRQPLASAFMIFTILFVVYTVYKERKKWKKARPG
jgi:putative tricarboxylic transport membrane protein